MANFISKQGIWKPAKERAVLPDAPVGKEIYEGPDRDALRILEEQGVDHLGSNSFMDPEMIMRAKQFGFNSVKEWAEMYGWSEEKQESLTRSRESQVITHKEPEPQKAVNPETGGMDTSGSTRGLKGGFGEWQTALSQGE